MWMDTLIIKENNYFKCKNEQNIWNQVVYDCSKRQDVLENNTIEISHFAESFQCKSDGMGLLLALIYCNI